MLQSTGSQIFGHDLVTEQEYLHKLFGILHMRFLSSPSFINFLSFIYISVILWIFILYVGL